jgi:hypothetical protein
MAASSPAIQFSGPGSSIPSASTPPAGSSPSRHRRRDVLLAVAVLVVAVLLVVALLLIGVIPGLRPGSTGHSGEALSYSAARSLADPLAIGAAGGPWTLFEAYGYEERANLSFGIAFLDRLESVGPLDIHYLTPARPGIPAFDGSLSSGLSPWWLFQYTNGTTTVVAHGGPNETVILGVVVVNGTATALATYSSILNVGIPLAIPGAGIIDSPAAMAAAVASNTSFVGVHPDLNASFWPEFLPIPPGQGWYWTVALTTCGNYTTAYNGSAYYVEVNATSGAVPGPGSSGTVRC